MKLAIEAGLSEPPSDSLCFRFLTQKTKQDFHADNLVLVEISMRDVYYLYLLRKGLLDYIDDLITPAEERFDLLIASRPNPTPCLLTRGIFFENINSLLARISDWF